jgi:NAD(P)-dependent dehydrogenase (short-subunit alcohol dehydrogenase family)
MKLTGKVSLITGGTGGIGAATALKLGSLGSDIAIVGRTIDGRAAAIKKEAESLGRRCLLLAADISAPEEVTLSVKQTVDQMGSVDILVHAAGGGIPGSLLEVTPEAWYKAFDVHVHAVFHLCRATVPFIKKRGE